MSPVRFLEALAVCGRPVLPARIFEACGFRGDERPLVARLRAAHLVRNSRSAERVEMYHDRIRETLAARVSPDAARRIHELMAQVLVAHGDDDPEALFDHYRAAGSRRARGHPGGRRRGQGERRAGLRSRGHVLSPCARPAARRRRASGVERGPRAERSRTPAGRWKRRMPTSTRPAQARRRRPDRMAAQGRRAAAHRRADRSRARGDRRCAPHAWACGWPRALDAALASLALRRLQLRWRGLEFRARPDAPIAQEDLLRIDACWSITVGMAMVDPMRAADVQRQAVALGARRRRPVSRRPGAGARGGVLRSFRVGAGRQRVETLRRQATALAPPRRPALRLGLDARCGLVSPRSLPGGGRKRPICAGGP